MKRSLGSFKKIVSFLLIFNLSFSAVVLASEENQLSSSEWRDLKKGQTIEIDYTGDINWNNLDSLEYKSKENGKLILKVTENLSSLKIKIKSGELVIEKELSRGESVQNGSPSESQGNEKKSSIDDHELGLQQWDNKFALRIASSEIKEYEKIKVLIDLKNYTVLEEGFQVNILEAEGEGISTSTISGSDIAVEDGKLIVKLTNPKKDGIIDIVYDTSGDLGDAMLFKVFGIGDNGKEIEISSETEDEKNLEGVENPEDNGSEDEEDLEGDSQESEDLEGDGSEDEGNLEEDSQESEESEGDGSEDKGDPEDDDSEDKEDPEDDGSEDKEGIVESEDDDSEDEEGIVESEDAEDNGSEDKEGIVESEDDDSEDEEDIVESEDPEDDGSEDKEGIVGSEDDNSEDEEDIVESEDLEGDGSEDEGNLEEDSQESEESEGDGSEDEGNLEEDSQESEESEGDGSEDEENLEDDDFECEDEICKLGEDINLSIEKSLIETLEIDDLKVKGIDDTRDNLEEVYSSIYCEIGRQDKEKDLLILGDIQLVSDSSKEIDEDEVADKKIEESEDLDIEETPRLPKTGIEDTYFYLGLFCLVLGLVMKSEYELKC